MKCAHPVLSMEAQSDVCTGRPLPKTIDSELALREARLLIACLFVNLPPTERTIYVGEPHCYDNHCSARC